MTAMTKAPALAWMTAATEVLDRIAATQAGAIEEASQWCADAIAADGLVHLFGTGHSRIPSRRCSRATARTRVSTRSSSCR